MKKARRPTLLCTHTHTHALIRDIFCIAISLSTHTHSITLIYTSRCPRLPVSLLVPSQTLNPSCVGSAYRPPSFFFIVLAPLGRHYTPLDPSALSFRQFSRSFSRYSTIPLSLETPPYLDTFLYFHHVTKFSCFRGNCCLEPGCSSSIWLSTNCGQLLLWTNRCRSIQ